MLLTRLPTDPIGPKMSVATTFADASTKYMVENPLDSHKIGKHGPVRVQIEKIQMQNAKTFRNCWLRHLWEPCRGKDMLWPTEFLSSCFLSSSLLLEALIYFTLSYKAQVNHETKGIRTSLFTF